MRYLPRMRAQEALSLYSAMSAVQMELPDKKVWLKRQNDAAGW